MSLFTYNGELKEGTPYLFIQTFTVTQGYTDIIMTIKIKVLESESQWSGPKRRIKRQSRYNKTNGNMTSIYIKRFKMLTFTDVFSFVLNSLKMR